MPTIHASVPLPSWLLLPLCHSPSPASFAPDSFLLLLCHSLVPPFHCLLPFTVAPIFVTSLPPSVSPPPRLPTPTPSYDVYLGGDANNPRQKAAAQLAEDVLDKLNENDTVQLGGAMILRFPEGPKVGAWRWDVWGCGPSRQKTQINSLAAAELCWEVMCAVWGVHTHRHARGAVAGHGLCMHKQLRQLHTLLRGM